MATDWQGIDLAAIDQSAQKSQSIRIANQEAQTDLNKKQAFDIGLQGADPNDLGASVPSLATIDPQRAAQLQNLVSGIDKSKLGKVAAMNEKNAKLAFSVQSASPELQPQAYAYARSMLPPEQQANWPAVWNPQAQAMINEKVAEGSALKDLLANKMKLEVAREGTKRAQISADGRVQAAQIKAGVGGAGSKRSINPDDDITDTGVESATGIPVSQPDPGMNVFRPQAAPVQQQQQTPAAAQGMLTGYENDPNYASAIKSGLSDDQAKRYANQKKIDSGMEQHPADAATQQPNNVFTSTPKLKTDRLKSVFGK